jgi:hypothetical protein
MHDYEGKPLVVGARVELHPGCDLWMRGAKYGVIESVDAQLMIVRVRLDNAPRKARTFSYDRVRVIGARGVGCGDA